MEVDMIVCVKQVMDPETPASAFQIDPDVNRVQEAPGIPPVVNGFDDTAVEAALKIKDAQGGTITILSVGANFVMDVMKKPLSMGADSLVLAQDEAFDDLDSFATARVLAEAIRKIDRFDMVICGRQASDWDNGQVPLGIAELLGLPCLTMAQNVEVVDSGVVVQRVLSDGYEVVEADLPALVTVSNELGEPRYATLRGIMAAGRKTPTVLNAADLGIDAPALEPRVRVTGLDVPVTDRSCEFIEGEDEADSGRLLALRLREAGLI
ncbi:MAG: electron transfer flavoprotein subunit beta/FixA family protein [SAR202 cluster bacterium]|jgi:electron transfer flavoprotein beta subunit|nr:electron transfer flavoprotein subunit beta/FixA family protein [SAR202 cluster bacterium]